MAIKGVATIQLIDANGDVVSEQTDENMITDLASDLINPQWNLQTTMMNGASSTVCTARNLVNSVFKGIRTWDNIMTESSDATCFEAGVSCLGYAASESADSDTKRGSYNTNESGEITNGYRHVWDFGTDKSNGTIKCLTLCPSYIGDNTSLYIEYTASANLVYGSVNFSGYNLVGIVNYHALYLATINDVVCLCVKKDSFNPNKTKLIHDMNRTNLTPDYYIPVSDLTTATCVSAITTPAILINDDYIYVGTTSYYYEKVFKKLNWELEVIQTEDFSDFMIGSTNSTESPIGIIDGYVFMTYDNGYSSDNGIYVYDYETKNLLSSFSYSGLYRKDSYYALVARQLYIKNKNGKYFVNLGGGNGNDSSAYVYAMEMIDLELEEITTFLGAYSAASTYLYIVWDRGILGNSSSISTSYWISDQHISSINNLETPVTKTADLTMKIIYDLTQESE